MMKRVFVWFIIGVFLCNVVFAFQISVSPAHLDFFGNVGEVICKKIEVYTDRETLFIVDDKWSLEDGNGNFLKYNLDARELGLRVKYNKEIFSVDRKFDFCISSEREGRFFGIVYFRVIDGPEAVGSLVDVRIGKRVNLTAVWLLIFSLILYSVLLAILVVRFMKRDV